MNKVGEGQQLKLASAPEIGLEQVPFGSKLRIFFGPLEPFNKVRQKNAEQQRK